MTIEEVVPSSAVRRVSGMVLCHVFPPRFQETGRPPFVALDGKLVIGRDPQGEHTYLLEDPTASRSHCSLSWSRGKWRVDDLDSSNGTHVNGRKVQSAWLAEQDVLRVGGNLFVLAGREPVDLRPLWSEGIVAASHGMAQVLNQVEKEGRGPGNMLIVGETGTGKDLLCQLIHTLSGRPGKFVAVNCAAIPETLLESTLFGSVKGAFTGSDSDRPGLLREAGGGTLLLDEVGEMSSRLQAKLLRAIEEKAYTPVGSTVSVSFEAKLLAATNNVESLRTGDRSFRQDLLARLEDSVVILPPLRARKEDISLIVGWLLTLEAPDEQREVTCRFMERLHLDSWPRNVRQLVKVVQAALRATAPEDHLDIGSLEGLLGWERKLEVRDAAGAPAAGSRAKGGGASVRAGSASPPRSPGDAATAPQRPEGRRLAPTAQQLKSLLDAYHGKVAEVARHLGCDRRQVYRWLKAAELNVPEPE
jgi:transcriptional regulator with PAS, ATPase and Fis domain